MITFLGFFGNCFWHFLIKIGIATGIYYIVVLHPGFFNLDQGITWAGEASSFDFAGQKLTIDVQGLSDLYKISTCLSRVSFDLYSFKFSVDMFSTFWFNYTAAYSAV